MAYELYVRHYGRDGLVKTAAINPLWARYTDTVDDQPPVVLAVGEDHPAAAAFEEFDVLEVLVRNKEFGLLDYTRAAVGVVRVIDRSTDEDGLTTITVTAPDENHILSWRSILWPAGTADRSEFSSRPAESVMKDLVKYNATNLALAASGRWRDGGLAAGMGVTITVAADLGQGFSVSTGLTGKNLLAALQRVASIGGGDFQFDWQGGGDWLFDFKPGQLGEDKSTGTDRVLFDLASGNMSNPRLTVQGASFSVTVSAGQEQGVDRQVSVVTGPDYAADYDVEGFTDARNEGTENGRIYRAELALEAARLKRSLTFDVLQTSAQFYSPVPVVGRKTYRAGDLVLASYGVESVRKITSVAADWRPGRSDSPLQVRVETEEV